LDQLDSNTDNNTASAETVGASPDIDLNLSKTATDTVRNSVTTITYTITISNPTVYNATGVVVSDTLPISVTFVSSQTTNNSVYNFNTGVWAVGDVAAHSDVILTIVVTSTLSAGEMITNTAVITSLDQHDPNNGNDSESAGVTIDSDRGGIFLPIIMKASS